MSEYKDKLIIFDCNGVLVDNYYNQVPGIENILVWVLDNNISKCVASNSNFAAIKYVLEKAKLKKFFTDQEIFGVDIVKKLKPDPAIFNYAANSKGYSINDCLVIEDSYPGLVAANRAGMEVIWFNKYSKIDYVEEVEILSICNDLSELEKSIKKYFSIKVL